MFSKYIGIPYKEKGRDIAGVDCWGLVRLIYKNEFNIDLPSFAEEYHNTTTVSEAISAHIEGWEQVTELKVGDSILFRIVGEPTHIGVYIGNDKFIHTRRKSGTVVESLNSINWRSRIVGYYKYSASNFAYLTVLPEALSTTRITLPIEEGTTIGQLIDSIKAKYFSGDREVLYNRVTVLLNSTPITQKNYNTIIHVNDIIEYRVIPGEDAFKMVAFVVIAIYAPQMAASLMSYATGTAVTVATMGTAGWVLAAGIQLVGGMLLNAIFPVKPLQNNMQDPGATEALNLMQARSNRAALYQPIPVVLGTTRITPPLAASGFVESSERDSYYNMMLCWGIGPVRVSDIRIGDTSIDQYENQFGAPVQYETLGDDIGLDDYAGLRNFNSIYCNDVKQNAIGITLTNNPTDGNPWTESTLLEQGITRLAVNFYFPRGLRRIITMGSAAGTNQAKECQLELQVRSLDAGGTPLEDWKDPNSRLFTEARLDLPSAVYYTSEWWGDSGYVTTNYGYQWHRVVINTAGIISLRSGGICKDPYSVAPTNLIVSGTLRFPNLNPGDIELGYICIYGVSTVYNITTNHGTTGFTYTGLNLSTATRTISRYIGGEEGWADSYITQVVVSAGSISKNSTIISLGLVNYVAKKDAFTHTEYIGTPTDLTGNGTGTYQIRVRRLNSDLAEPSSGIQDLHEVTLQTFTGYTLRPAISLPPNVKVARTAIKIKASNQLNGNIEGINGLVSSICLAYSRATQTWVYATTNNPAHLFRYVLEHPGNAFRITNAAQKINIPALEDWSNFCQDNKLTYNAVISSSTSVLDTLRDIAAAGMASPAMVDGKWTVNIDRPRTDIVQCFTPSNSWGFESTKKLTKLPDGLKVNINNELKNYDVEELIVYNSGKDVTNSSIFETISLPGITDPLQAQRMLRWHMAQAVLRPEVYTLNTDIEYIVCNRGDRVKITHDIPMWGAGYGRISSKLSDTKFIIDNAILLEQANSYIIRIRSVQGTSKVSNIKSIFTINSASVLNNILTIDIGEHPFQIDDNISFNIVGGDLVGAITQAVILSTTSSTVSVPLVFADNASIPITGEALLADGYYTYIVTETPFTNTEAIDDDLVLIGTSTQQDHDLVVLSIEPLSNNSAKLTLNDYSPEIYTVDYISNNFVIPPYASNITKPREILDQSTVLSPIISTVISDESVLTLVGPGVLSTNLQINFTNQSGLPYNVKFIECAIKLEADTEDFYSTVKTVPISISSVTFSDVLEGNTYSIKSRYVGLDGRLGPWSSATTHNIVGKTTPPADVYNFTHSLNPATGIATLSWDSNKELDTFGYEIRSVDMDWGTDTGYLYKGKNTLFDVISTDVSQTLYIRAIDTGKRYSTNSVSTTISRALPDKITSLTSSNFSSTNFGAFVEFTWDAAVSTDILIKYYRVTFSKPGFAPIVVDNYTGSILFQADWLGTADISITTVDILERSSSTNFTGNISKYRPNDILLSSHDISKTNVLLSWIAPAITSLAIGGFEVRSSDDGWGTNTGSFIWRGLATSYLVSDIQLNSTYYIKCFDTSNTYNQTALIHEINLTAPGAPINIQGTYLSTAGTSQLDITWDATPGTFDIDHYIISLDKPVGYTDTTLISTTKHITTNIDWIGSCDISVQSVDRFGIISNLSSTYVLQRNIPNVVGTVSVTYSSTALRTTWEPVTQSINGLPIAGYEIRTTSSGFGSAGAVWKGSLTEVILTSFVLGVNTWYIAAYDTNNVYGAAISFQHTVQASSVPTNVSAIFVDTISSTAQAFIQWDTPINIYFKLSYYTVTVVKPNSSIYSIDIFANKVYIPVDWEGIANISVKAVDILGNASTSSTNIQLNKLNPLPPSNVQTSYASNAISISWDAPGVTSLNIAGYEITNTGELPGNGVWKGNVENATIFEKTSGYKSYDLYAFDTDLGYSTPINVSYTIIKPPTPVKLLTGYIFAGGSTGNTVRLTWESGAYSSVPDTFQLPIKYYKVSINYTIPYNNTIEVDRLTTDWELGVTWEGDATVTIIAVDELDTYSDPLVFTVTKQKPNTPSNIVASTYTTGLFLDWPDTVITSLPVTGYELRTSTTGWGSSGFLWRGSSSQYTLDLRPLVSDGDTFPKTISLYLKSIDSSNTYSTGYTTVAYTVYRPIAPVITEPVVFSTDTGSATITVSWSAVTTTFGLDGYIVTFNGNTIYTKATSITLPANWIGTLPFRVQTVDMLGIKSSQAELLVDKYLPNPPTNIRAQVIDNNVLIYWDLPAPTTLPISNIVLKKGANFDTADLIGAKSGTFTTISELQGGDYTYWLVSVDTDGRESAPSVPLVSKISQPPDFIFNAEYFLDYTTSTNSNAKTSSDGASLILPVNNTETFSQHFTSHSWAGPQAQVTAGYPIYIQPGITSGYYEQIFDYGSVLGSSQITANLSSTMLSGTPSIVTTISTSLDGVSYTAYVGTQIFVSNFRYIKVRIEVTQSVVGDLLQLNASSIRLDAKQVTDSGNAAVGTSGTIVNFNKEIIDVVSLLVAPSGTTPLYAVYDFSDYIREATYSISGNVCTVSYTSHNIYAGMNIRASMTSGSAPSGVYTVNTVPNANTFTILLTTANTSGNLLFYPNSMRLYVFDHLGNAATSNVSWSLRGY